MTIYAWPPGFVPARASLRSITNSRSNTSAESGVTQTIVRPGSRWGWSIEMPAMTLERRAAFEAWLTRLSGMTHRAAVSDWMRPRPRGTCNVAGVSVAGGAPQFSATVPLQGCGAGRTLLAGDWIKFMGGQLCMVAADAQADGAGLMTVEVRHELRVALAAGSPVTLDAPTALYIATDATHELPRAPGLAQPAFGFDLIEVFS